MPTNHSKLKANLKLAIQRLKLLEKKKTENARKATKEIADFIQINKYDRARIKVEHIIREDYMVEGMEIVEMYCDLLLARFGLVESMKELDLGLYECVASLFWVAPRLESECIELKVIADELQHKYGKEFAQMCRANKSEKVNERLMIKMSEQAPDRLLVEKYLVEIAKSHQVPFKPDPDLEIRDPNFFFNSVNESHQRKGNNGGGSSNNGGSSAPPGFSDSPKKPEQEQASASSPRPAQPPLYPTSNQVQQVSYIGFNQTNAAQALPTKKSIPSSNNNESSDNIQYPSVPDSLPQLNNRTNNNNSSNNGSDSFDDLAARFENLKKK